MINTREQF